MNEPLTYRNVYPTVPGWYWLYLVYPAEMGEKPPVLAYYGEDKIVPVEFPTPKWAFFAGPLTPPAKPEIARCP